MGELLQMKWQKIILAVIIVSVVAFVVYKLFKSTSAAISGVAKFIYDWSPMGLLTRGYDTLLGLADYTGDYTGWSNGDSYKVPPLVNWSWETGDTVGLGGRVTATLPEKESTAKPDDSYTINYPDWLKPF